MILKRYVLIVLTVYFTVGAYGESEVGAHEWAFRFVSEIPEKVHGSDKGRGQYEVVRSLVELGRIDDAERLAPAIHGWRRGLALAELAVHFAAADNADSAAMYVSQATDYADTLTGKKAGWQKQRIVALAAKASVRMKRIDQAGELTGHLDQVQGAVVVAEGARAAGIDGKIDAAIADLDRLLQAKEWEVKEAVALAFAGLVSQELPPEKLALIREKFEASLGPLPYQMGFELRIEFARGAKQGGNLALANEMLDALEKEMTDHEVVNRYVVEMTCELAIASKRYFDAADRAGRLVAFADKGLASPRLLTLDRASSMLAVAKAYQVIGNRAKADALLTGAYKIAAENPNGRARALLLGEFCVAVGECGGRFPGGISTQLPSQLRRLGAPW